MLKQIKKTGRNISLASKMSGVLRFVLFLVALTGVFLYTRVGVPERASAATSSNLNFQARLLTSAGAIVPDGSYNIEFKLYNVSSGGSALWTETWYDSNGVTAGNDNRVQVKSGYLSVYLGSLTSFPSLNWDQDMYLTMNIGGTTQTATPTWDGEMTPRLKLTAVPYAFAAGQLAKINGANSLTVNLANPSTGTNTITFPDANGTVCLQAASACGFETTSGTDFIRNQTSTQTANFNIQSASASSIAAVINSAANPSVDVFDVQKNGTNILRVTSAGYLQTLGGILSQGSLGSSNEAATILVQPGGTTRGINIESTSGTGNLFELQSGSNLNATNTLAKFDANGNFSTYGTNNSLLALGIPTFTTSSTGTSYYYVITATNAQGETVASASLGMANNTSALAWTQVPGATGYKIYRNTTNAFTSGSLLLTTITNAGATGYTDTGSATGAGLPPTSPAGTTVAVTAWGSQTNNALQVGTAAAPAAFFVRGSGSFGGTALTVATQNSASFVSQFRGTTSQTGDLLQLQDVNSVNLSKFDANGALTTYGTSNTIANLNRPTFTTSSTGTSFYYIITATNAAGETIASTSLGMANNTSTLQWSQINGATGYKIYRNTTNSFTSGSLLLTTITNGTTVSFTDTGAATGAGLPPVNPANSPQLTLQAWNNQPGSSPILSFTNALGSTMTYIGGDGRISATSININTGGAGLGGTLAVQSVSTSAISEVIRAISSQTADLLQLQDNNGNINSAFSATGAQLTLGRIASSGTVTSGSLVFGDGTTDNFSNTLNTATLTGSSKTISLPNENGTLCIQNSTNCGFALTSGSGNYVQFAPSSAQADTSTNSSIFINKTGASGNILELQNGGTDKVVVSNAGQLQLFGAAASTNVLTTRVTGDTNDRLTIGADGKLSFGSGSGAADNVIFRGTNQVLNIQSGKVSINTKLAIGFDTNPGTRLLVNNATGTTSDAVVILKGATSQTGDQLELQDANAVTLSKFDANGALTTYGTSNTFAALATPAFTTSSSGTNYYYVITATNAAGETVASASLGMANNTSALAWSQVNGATGYKIYRNTSNSFTSGSLLLTTITNGTTVGYTDTGSATGAGLPPTAPTGTKLTLQSWGGQSGDVMQVLDSNSIVRAGIGPTGQIYSGSNLGARINGVSLGTSQNAAAFQNIASSTAAVLLVKGGATPGSGGNLIDLQDSSGNLLTQVTAAGYINVLRAVSATDSVFTSRVAGDTNDRFTLGADGKLSFGPGNAATDTVLQRTGVAVLNTAGTFTANGGGRFGPVALPVNTQFFVSSQAANYNTLSVRGFTSQTADLLQNQDVNGAVLSKFDANGALTTYGVNNTFSNLATPAFTTSSSGSSYYYVITATNAAGETVASASLGMANNTSALAWSQVTGATGYKIYRNTSNSFTSGSLLLTTITNGTTVSFTDTGAATGAGLPPTAPTGNSLTIQGWANQTSNLLQLQNASGTIVDKFDASGNLTVSATGNSSFAGSLGVGTTSTGNLASNPDFENWTSGVPNSWSLGANASVTQVSGYTGSSAVRLTDSVSGNTGNNRLSSSSGLVSPSTTYTISYWARRVSGTGALYIAIDNTGGQLAPFTDTTGNWIRVSQTVTTSSTSSTVMGFYANVAGDTFDIDDVQVELGSGLTPFNSGLRTAGDLTAVGKLAVTGNIITNGNVGIGIAIPTARLQVNTDAATVGQIIRGNVAQSADLLQLQDSAGNVNGKFNATGNQLTLGRVAGSGTVTQGSLLFADGTTDGFSATLQAATQTANTIFQLPAAAAGTYTLCTTASSVCATPGSGFVQFAPSSAQADSTTNSSIFINKTGASGNILELQNGGTDKVVVSNAGQLQLFGAAASTNVLTTRVTGDTNDRLTIGADGKLSFGSGSGAADNVIFRGTNGVLNLQSGKVDVSARLAVGTDTNPGTRLLINNASGTTSDVVAILKGAASQTGDQLELQDANAVTLSKFDANGGLTTYGSNTNHLALATPAFTTASSGTNYYYVITATNAAGETVASASLGMANNTSALAWSQVTGATGYKIYRNTSNSFAAGSLLLTTITNGTTVGFTDSGAATGAGLPPTAPTGTGLTIQGWGSQTANPLSVNNGAGVGLLAVNSNGDVGVGKRLYVGNNTSGISANGQLEVVISAANRVGQVIRANASQGTTDLFELQDNSGNVNAAFNATGNQLTLGRVAGSGTVTAGNLLFADGTIDGFAATVGTNTLTANRTYLLPDTALATTGSPGTICVFNGANSNCPAATGSNYYIQNTTGSATPQTGANFNIQATSSTTNGTIGGIIRGAAGGQTVDLFQLQATGGSVLSKFDANGYLSVGTSTSPTGGVATFNGNVGIGTTSPTSKLEVSGGSLTIPATSLSATQGLIIKEGATNIANLQALDNAGTSIALLSTNRTYGVGGWSSTGWNGSRAAGSLQVDDDVLNFYQFAGSSNVGTEVFRVSPGGNLGIGYAGATAPGLLQVTQRTTGFGTVSTNGTTTLTGTNTQFLNTFKVGDTITVSGETVRTIASITDNTHLAVSVAFSTTASSLSYTLTGGDRLTVLGNGNVGIGTIAPATALDVYASTHASVRVVGTGDGANFSSLILGSDEATDKSWVIAHRQFAGETNKLITYYFDGVTYNPRTTIDTSGNFGIGTTTPRKRLDVLDASSPQLRLTQADNAQYVDFQVDGSSNLTISPQATGKTLTATGFSTVNFGSNALVTSSATALNLQSDGGGIDVNIAGGSSATGCTIANATGNLTCSGTITGSSSSYTQGSAIFAGASGVLTQDNANFYFDGTNHTLGVGTTRSGAIDGTGNSRLVVKGSGTTSSTSSLNIKDSSNNSLLFVRDDGNVGIGTTAPGSLLTLQGTQPAAVSGTGTAGTQVLGVTGAKGGNTNGGTATAGAGSVITLTSGAGGDAVSGSTNGNGGNGGSITLQTGAGGAGIGSGTAGSYGNIILQSSGGNVGIGTNSPSQKLEVAGTTKTTSLISNNRLAQGSRATYIYDDFDRSNRVLNGDTTPTGQTWVVSGPGQTTANISSGSLNDTVNYYASLDYGSAITREAGTFSFTTGNGTDRTIQTIALIADQTQIGLADMLHLTIGPNGWALTKRQAAGAFVPMATGTLNLRTDGTVYPVALEINTSANTVTVVAPDGTRTTVTDAAVSAINGRYGIWQYTGDATGGYKTRWNSVSMGPSVAESLRAEGLGASLSDLTLFSGTGLTQRQKISGTLSGGAGWYRVATYGVLGTYAISGNVKVTALDGLGRNTYWDIDASTQIGGGTPKLSQNYADTYSGGAITQARLSRDDSGLNIGLDVYVPNANAVTYSIEFLGAFTPVGSPTVGATAYSTTSNTITIDPATNKIIDVLGGNNAGLTLNAGGTNQSIILQPSGTGGVGINTTNTSTAKLVVKGSTSDATAAALNVVDSSNNSKFYVRNDGNVGIGTTSPTAALHVTATNGTNGGTGTAGTAGLTVVAGNGGNSSTASTAGGAGGAISLTAGNGGNSTGVAGTNGANITLQGGAGGTGTTTGAYGNIVLNANGGNVGIGTASPTNKLQVTGTAAAPSLSSDTGIFKITANTTQELAIGGDSSSPFGVWLQTKRTTSDGTSWPLALNPLGGNVGIGTTNPTQILTLGEGADRTINIETRTSNAAGRNFTLVAGAGGSGANAVAGGSLSLQGGAAAGSGTGANGGNVALQGGAGVGTGVQGLVTLSTTSFTAASTQSIGSSSSITQSVVDNNSTIPINATAASLTITVPAPTQNVVGRILYITAVNGSNSFTISPSGGTSFTMAANVTATFIWNGTAWTNAGVDGGSSSYIQNQNSSDQTTANFRISGTGRANTSFTTPLLDAIGSGTLGVGTATTGNLTIGNNTAGGTNSTTLQAGTGGVTVQTAVSSGGGNTGAISIQTGNAASGSNNTSGGITLKTGDASGGNASSGGISIDVGSKTGSGTAGSITIGTGTNAPSAITIGKSGVTTNIQGNLGVGNSSGANPFAINTLTTAQSGYQATISTGGTSNNGLVIQGVASQGSTSKYLSIQDSAGANIWQVRADDTEELGSSTHNTSILFSSTDLSHGGLQKNLTAGTGGVSATDVVIFANDSGNARVIDTTTSNDSRVFGVAMTTASAGNTVTVNTYGYAIVKYTGTAPAIGDILVTSTVAGSVKVDNFATKGILGYATTAGSGGTVGVVINPVGGAGGSDGNSLVQVPASNTAGASGANVISPTANSVVGLTVNGTSGTAATAVNIVQGGNAADLTLSNTASTSGNLISLTHSTSAFTGTALLFNMASGSGSFASGNFIDLQTNGTSKFSISSAGVLTLAGAQTADITTAAGTAPTALVFQPGNNTTATSSGAALTVQAGNDSGVTAATGGLLTLKGGNATGGSQTGGGVTLDSGSGTTGGAISIGTTNAASISEGRNGITTTNNGALTVTQGFTANGGISVAANQNLTLQSGTGVFSQTYSAATATSAQTLSVTNTNAGAGVTSQGINITPNLSGTPSSSTNTLNVLNFAAGGTATAANRVTNGINFASATGYTNFISTPTFVLSSSGAISGVTTYNGLGLTSQADGFTVAGGTTSRTLTVTAADITVGSTIKPTSAGALTVQSNGANNLTLDTGGATVNIATNTSSGSTAVTIGNTTSNPNISFNGSGTFGTTTGAVSLNGNTTVAASKTLTVTSGLTSLTGATTGDALNVSNSTSSGNIVVFKSNASTVATIGSTGFATFNPLAATSGSPTIFTLTGPAHTGLTNAEAIDANLNLARTVTFTGGASTSFATQRVLVVQAPTYAATTGTLTITDAATEAITGAPVKGSNVALTNTHALLIQSGAVSTATNSYGLTVNAQTGASNNYAAEFLGGNVGIGTTNPSAQLHVVGAAPATAGSSSGSAGTNGLTVTAGDGQGTTGTSPNSGGNGGAISNTTGAGGAATGGTGANTGGTGGSYTINTGAGGAASSTTAAATAGTGGALAITTGNGGAESGAGSAATLAGNGGAISFTSGNGGNVTSSGGTAGSGGTISLQGGTAGTGGSTAGHTGYVTLQATGGNVGIGIANPSYKLHIATSTANDQAIRAVNSATTGANYGGAFIANGAATTNYGAYAQATGAGQNINLYLDTQTGGSNNYSIYSAATANSYFAGNVGIGTTSPTSVLHTIATGAKTATYTGNLLTNTATSSTASINKYGLEIQSTGTWNGTSANNVGLYVSSVTGGTNNYDAIFNGGGNVGIGTTTPGAKLEVTGAGNTIGSIALAKITTTTGRPVLTLDTASGVTDGGAINFNKQGTGDFSIYEYSGGSGAKLAFFQAGYSDIASISNGGLGINIGGGTPRDQLDVNSGARIGLAPSSATTVTDNPLTAAATTLNVVSTAGYPQTGTLLIDSEALTYTNITATSFTGLARGEFGTTPASHVSSSIVNNYLLTVRTGNATTPKLAIMNTGNVGIGTSTPVATFDTRGTAQFRAVTDSATGFMVQNAFGAASLTVDTTNTSGSLNIAVNGGGETGGTPPTGWSAVTGTVTPTITQTTTTGEYTSGAAAIKVAFGSAGTGGVKNTVGTAAAVSTTYTASFSIKSSSGTPTLSVLFSPDGSATVTCAAGSYASSGITAGFVKYTCTFTTASSPAINSSAYISISQTDSTLRNLFIDNLSLVAQNSSGTQNTGVLKVGGANGQGLTLLQLDTAAGTPFTGANQTLAGAMYFDTTAGKMQCYDGTQWGACGAAPNSLITLTPEYAGAVLHGTADAYGSGTDKNLGTLSSDFCSNETGVLVVPATGNICLNHEARNYYNWTTVQTNYQSYGVYVTYKLPSTFKAFVGNVSVTGRVDNTTNAGVNYTIYRSTGSAITQCGGGTGNVVGWTGAAASSSANTWSSATLNPATSCTFAANDYLIIKVDVVAKSSANAYIENLNFTYSNQ